MEITQAVLKYTNIYGITFDDKYAGIKTILTTEGYNTKFSTNSINGTSQTSTVLSNNNSYYNIVDRCTLVNCNVKNGKFVNSKLMGLSGITNYINDGYFSGCTISGYIINNGKFYDCVIDSNNIWKNGQWNNNNGSSDFQTSWSNGVWNSGVFSESWYGGTFNGGTFKYPAVWYNGIANDGTFSGITWHHGLVRNAEFKDNCTFENGTFNNGKFTNSVFNDGVWNNGTMLNSIVSGGTFYAGNFSGCIIDQKIGDKTEIDGGKFNSVTINNGDFFNIDAINLTVKGGNFYSGDYSNSNFIGGDIYYGLYLNVTGSTSGLTIHNGILKNSTFKYSHVHNGNFTNCLSTGLTWEYGVYTEGNMYGGVWRDGYWNDGIMSGTTWNDGQFYGGTFTGNFNGGTFHYGTLNGVEYVQSATKPKPFIIKKDGKEITKYLK